MRKVILFLTMLFCLCISANAQKLNYRAQNFAIASVYNGYYTWGEWQKSNIKITIDADNDVIYIWSSTTQVYKVYATDDPYTDKDGGTQVKFYVIDQDYDKGSVRLRIQRDGTSQIYVDFSDVAWCYGNVIRI